MPLNTVDAEALQKTAPLLIVDVDPEELITALYNIVLDQSDKTIIMKQKTHAEKITKLIQIYNDKASSLTPLENALIDYMAQPHVVQQLKENKRSHAVQENEMSLNQNDPRFYETVHMLKQSYQKGFARFKPLPNFKRVFDISKIWINLQLENKAESEPPEDYHSAIINALVQSPLAIVKGRPGIGKTMTQKRIAYDWATGKLPEFDLVLFSRLRDMPKDDESCLDVALNWLTDMGYLKENHKLWILDQKENLVSGPICERDNKLHVLILLDGLDEAAGKCFELQKLLYSDDMLNIDYSVVLTTRPETVEDVMCSAPLLVINPLTNDQTQEYVVKHFTITNAKTATEEADKFEQKLKEHPVWTPLAQIPLFLCCMCLVIHRLTSGTAVELFLKVCQSLALQRQSSLASILGRSYESICQKSTVISNLAKMAFFGLMGEKDKRKTVFSDEDLDLFNVDKEKCLHAGLLVLATDEEDVEINPKYEFLHYIFQELFAALLLFSEAYQLDHGMPPRYPEFATYESRLQSFASWPSGKRPASDHIAAAGFFWTGSTDYTRCFSCGIGISQWEPFDLPFWAHADISPTCAYLSFVKGRDFIDTVQVNPLMMNQCTTSADCTLINQNLDGFISYSSSMFTTLAQVKSLRSMEQTFGFLLEMASQPNISNEVTCKIAGLFSFSDLTSYIGHENGISNPMFYPLISFIVSTTRNQTAVLKIHLHKLFFLERDSTSLLAAVAKTNLTISSICDTAVYIPDIDVLFIFKKRSVSLEKICGHKSVELMVNEAKPLLLGCCLIDYEAMPILSDVCQKGGWNEIRFLRININENQTVSSMFSDHCSKTDDNLHIYSILFFLDFPMGTILSSKALSPILAKFQSESVGIQAINQMTLSEMEQEIVISDKQDQLTDILIPTLCGLTIDNTILSEIDFLSLLRILKDKPCIHVLSFNSFPSLKNSQMFAYLCEFIKCNKTLYYLGLKNNNLSIQQVRTICSAFKPSNSALYSRSICLYGNLVSEQNFKLLETENPGLKMILA